MEPVFFANPGEFHTWLEQNHTTAPELLVGYYRKGSGKPSMTWAESVEQALCFGWIDGVRRSVGDDAYSIRFTPRRPKSNWSLVNVRTVERLIAEGRMTETGLRAFEARGEATTGTYSFEQGEVALTAEDEALIRANPDAWTQWQKFPPSYRKQASWWVVSAKQAATRSRRLQQLIDDSARGERIGVFRPRPRA